MKKEELSRIISYVNEQIRLTISTDDSETNDLIDKGYFNEDEFTNNYIVEIEEGVDMKEINGYALSNNDIDNILDFVDDDSFYFVVDEVKELLSKYSMVVVDGDFVRQVIHEKLEE